MMEIEDCNSGIQIAELDKTDNRVVNGSVVRQAKVVNSVGESVGPILSNSFGPLMRNKKKRSKRNENSNGSENEVNQGVVVGIVNEEARDLIPSISLSKGSKGNSKFHVVARNPPGSNLSMSFSCDVNGAALGDVSVGDSGIQICNERF